MFCLTRIQGEASSRVVKESHQITQLLDPSGLELKFSNIFSILSNNIVNIFSRKTFIREIKSWRSHDLNEEIRASQSCFHWNGLRSIKA